jgi:hypothetical protein
MLHFLMPILDGSPASENIVVILNVSYAFFQQANRTLFFLSRSVFVAETRERRSMEMRKSMCTTRFVSATHFITESSTNIHFLSSELCLVSGTYITQISNLITLLLHQQKCFRFRERSCCQPIEIHSAW